MNFVLYCVGAFAGFSRGVYFQVGVMLIWRVYIVFTVTVQQVWDFVGFGGFVALFLK